MTETENIRERIKARGITMAQLSKRLKRSRTAVYMATDGSGRCKPLLFRIEKFLQNRPIK